MSDSLLLGSFELVDQSTGTPYQVVGDDRGGPVPDTATVVGTLLDGDRVTGHRSGNRTFTLPVTVTGSSRVDVAAKLNALVQIVDQPSFTLTWTPDGGLPVVFDCLRGSSVRVVDANVDAALYADVTLTFPALPFGRSTDPVTIGGVGSIVTIDAMDSGTYPGGGTTTHTTTSPVPYRGAGCAQVTATISGASWTATTGRSAPAGSVNISTETAVTFRVTIGGSLSRLRTLNQATVGLTDTHGSTASVTLSPGLSLTVGLWSLVSVPIVDFTVALATGQTAFDWTAVTAWQLTASGGTRNGATPSYLYLDDLLAVPAVVAVNSTSFGEVLVVPGIPGSARMPVSVEAVIGGSAFTTLLLHSPPPTQDPDAEILIPLTAGAGNVQPANIRYNGSYAVIVIINTPDSVARTITVDFNQITGSDTHSPFLGTEVAAKVTGSPLLVVVGFVTLPVLDFPDDNLSASLGVIVGSTGSDTFLGVALCDTEGQTVLLTGLDAFTESVWVDEPDPGPGVGKVFASPTTARNQAYSVLGKARTSGGPLVFEPGDNKLLVVSRTGVPTATVTGFPRWLDERTA